MSAKTSPRTGTLSLPPPPGTSPQLPTYITIDVLSISAFKDLEDNKKLDMDCRNYQPWSYHIARECAMVLLAGYLRDNVNRPACPTPLEAASDASWAVIRRAWIANNQRALGLILRNVLEAEQQHLMGATSAANTWKKLEDRHCARGAASKAELVTTLFTRTFLPNTPPTSTVASILNDTQQLAASGIPDTVKEWATIACLHALKPHYPNVHRTLLHCHGQTALKVSDIEEFLTTPGALGPSAALAAAAVYRAGAGATNGVRSSCRRCLGSGKVDGNSCDYCLGTDVFKGVPCRTDLGGRGAGQGRGGGSRGQGGARRLSLQ
jgi:hypothetical protein